MMSLASDDNSFAKCEFINKNFVILHSGADERIDKYRRTNGRVVFKFILAWSNEKINKQHISELDKKLRSQCKLVTIAQLGEVTFESDDKSLSIIISKVVRFKFEI